MKLFLRLTTLSSLLVWGVFFVQPIIYSQALSKEQKKALQSGVHYFNTEEGCPTGSTAVANTGIGAGAGKVYMIGDSIAEGTTPELTEAFKAKGFNTSIINPLQSRSLTNGVAKYDGVGILEADKAKYADATTVVIELGTNSSGLNPENIKKAVEIIKSANQTAKIFWVNIGVDNSKRASPLDAETLNDIINRSAPAGYSVIDWASQVKQHPEYIASDTYGVHASAAGKKPFAETVANGATGASATTSSNSSANCSCGGPATGGPLVGADNAEKVYNFLTGKGLTPPQAAGIMGNLQAESHFDPTIEQKPGAWSDMSGVYEKAVGIAQWDGGRRVALVRAAEAVAVEPKIDPKDLTFQLEYLFQEATARGDWDRIKQTATAADAAFTWHKYFEISNDGPERIQGRINFANDLLVRFGSGTGASVGATNGCNSGGSGLVNPDGYAFPLEAQKKIQYDDLLCSDQNKTSPDVTLNPDYSGKLLCHHDGTPAIDLSYGPAGQMVGKKVYAISDGKAIKISPVDADPNCMGIQFLSSKDNYYYWYGHVQNVSIQLNQPVKAGQVIAEVSAYNSSLSCASSGPHLHIDRGCVLDGKPQSAGGSKCRDPDFVPFMNKMWESLPS